MYSPASINVMRKIAVGILIVLFISFLVFEGRKLLLAPPLTLLSPPEDLITNNHKIQLAGQTDPGVRVTVNNTNVFPNEKGYFEDQIILQDGLNNLDIKAVRRYARPRLIQRKIFVNSNKTALAPYSTKDL